MDVLTLNSDLKIRIQLAFPRLFLQSFIIFFPSSGLIIYILITQDIEIPYTYQ